jgi:hypothetical protein
MGVIKEFPQRAAKIWIKIAFELKETPWGK